MNCTEFQDLLHDLAGNARLDEMTRQSALAHADSCPRCDETLAEARSVTGALRSLAAQDGTAEAPGHVEEVLRNAFRRNQSLEVHSRGSRWWTLASVASLAAAVLFSVLLLHHPGIPGPKLSNGSGASVVNQAAPAKTGVALQSERSVSSEESPRNGEATATSQNVALQDLDWEMARGFVPLPFGEHSMLPEDEVIVRVSLPPSALAIFGLPVSDAGRDENTFADFIVGEDGTPRAVRVVDE